MTWSAMASANGLGLRESRLSSECVIASTPVAAVTAGGGVEAIDSVDERRVCFRIGFDQQAAHAAGMRSAAVEYGYLGTGSAPRGWVMPPMNPCPIIRTLICFMTASSLSSRPSSRPSSPL